MKEVKGKAFGRGTYAHQNTVTAHLAAEGTTIFDKKPACGKMAAGTRVTTNVEQVDCERCRKAST